MPDFILSSFLTRFIDEEGLKSIQRFFIDEEGLKSIQRFVLEAVGDVDWRHYSGGSQESGHYSFSAFGASAGGSQSACEKGRSSSCRMALSTFCLNQWERR